MKKTSTGVVSVLNFSDYYPYGEQLAGRNTQSDYRYAFQGQELDKETGMEAFQLRLWDGRIGRWLSVDPKGQYSSPYLGMGNNPVSMIDPDGGYSWLGGFLRWAAGGFEGNFHKSTNEKWGWGTTYENKVIKTGSGEYDFTLIYNHDFGQKKRTNLFDWNSNFMRNLIADQYSISYGGGVGGVFGAGSSFTAHWLTRGPDASIIPYVNFLPDVDVNIGVGAAVTADLSFGSSSFRGKVKDITAASLIGPSRYISVTAADIIGGTAEYSQSFDNTGKTTWNNYSYGIVGGAGVRVQAGVKYTMVLIHTSGLYGIKRDGGFTNGYHLGSFNNN